MSPETTTVQAPAEAASHESVHSLRDDLSDLVHDWTTGLLGTHPAPTVARMLAQWRSAERVLESARPGSDGWDEAQEQFLTARSEYYRLVALAAADSDEIRRP